MLTFSQFISQQLDERFINAIGPNHPLKHQHAKELFDMLQKSYAAIGGIHGDGFKSPEDMIHNIPMWKMYKHEGKIKAAAFYKDTGGRKSVAIATDGSREGKLAVAHIKREDVEQKRAWSEVSGPALQFVKRRVGADKIQAAALTPADVERVSGKKTYPAPKNDPEKLAHPDLASKMYQRDIGGHMHTKVGIGTPGKTIVNRLKN